MSEAFARVLSALQRGAGPEMAFRPYLLTSVRNAFYDRTRKDKRLDVTDDVPEDLGRVLAAAAASEDDVERQLAATAFASLPERWQLVLWHTEVEGRSPAEVGPLLGLAPNAVAALAYRAREGLRQAYLNAHIQARPPAGCEDIVPKLGAYVRNDLSNRDRRKVEEHLQTCDRCTAIVIELRGGRVEAAPAAHPDDRRHPGRRLPQRDRRRRGRRSPRLDQPDRPTGEGLGPRRPGGHGGRRGRGGRAAGRRVAGRRPAP